MAAPIDCTRDGKRAANAWLKDHSIPSTFSMEGAGPRVCDEEVKDSPAEHADADR